MCVRIRIANPRDLVVLFAAVDRVAVSFIKMNPITGSGPPYPGEAQLAINADKRMYRLEAVGVADKLHHGFVARGDLAARSSGLRGDEPS